MKLHKYRKNLRLVCVALLVFMSASYMGFVHSVQAATVINVVVDSGKTTGTNELSLGFQFGLSEWRTFRDSSSRRQLAEDANFRMIKFFDIDLGACSYWYESSRTGSFNWANVDFVIQRIFEIGAEPMISLGAFVAGSGKPVLPRGMAVNPSTGLPYPNSWAAYCREWVRHFKQKGLPVRFYEIINEPWLYFGWDNYNKISRYITVFNAAARAMRQENPNVLLGQDAIMRKPVLNFWLNRNFMYSHEVGEDLGFLSFHKYDAGPLGASDSRILSKAETFKVKTDSGYYGIEDAQTIYRNWRGKTIPVINSETNLCSAFETGSDPRIQRVMGAVWLALVLRTGMLEGLSNNIYFTFTSSASSNLRKSSGGLGFGMINSDNSQPWYPYYVQKIVGTNLAVGDKIVESTSSSSNVRSIAWVHDGKLNVLLTCKVDSPRDVRLYGLQGSMNYFKIDNTISWQNPRVQTGTIYSTSTLRFNGYTVILLQQESSTPPPEPPPPEPPPPGSYTFEDGFEAGNFGRWTGTSSTSGESRSVVNTLSHDGTYSARFASNGNGGTERAYCYQSIASQSELYARGYFYVSQSGIAQNNDRFYFIRFRSGSNNIAYAGWMRIGGVVRWSLIIRDGTGWVTAASSTSPSLNQWYSVELHWLGASSNGLGELYVNGELVCSIQNRNTAALGSVNHVRFGLAEAYNCGSTTIYSDSCKISETYIGA